MALGKTSRSAANERTAKVLRDKGSGRDSLQTVNLESNFRRNARLLGGTSLTQRCIFRLNGTLETRTGRSNIPMDPRRPLCVR